MGDDLYMDVHLLRSLNEMNFGEALEALKLGKKVARAGWNGKGMWLILVPGTFPAKLVPGSVYHTALLNEFELTSASDEIQSEILPHIDMWTVNASGRRAMLPGWIASQTDMLAEDWTIVI